MHKSPDQADRMLRLNVRKNQMGNPECQSRDTNNIGYNTQNEEKQNQKHNIKKTSGPTKNGATREGKANPVLYNTPVCVSHVDKSLDGDREKQTYVEGIRSIVK